LFKNFPGFSLTPERPPDRIWGCPFFSRISMVISCWSRPRIKPFFPIRSLSFKTSGIMSRTGSRRFFRIAPTTLLSPMLTVCFIPLSYLVSLTHVSIPLPLPRPRLILPFFTFPPPLDTLSRSWHKSSPPRALVVQTIRIPSLHPVWVTLLFYPHFLSPFPRDQGSAPYLKNLAALFSPSWSPPSCLSTSQELFCTQFTL